MTRRRYIAPGQIMYEELVQTIAVKARNSSEVYVYLKRPFLFNIRYNSREIWNKMTEEDKVQYINYEEFYEEYRLIRLRSIGYPILAVVYLFAMSAMILYIIYMFTGFNIFSLFV